MSIRHWLRPPRHLLVLFLGTTLVLLGGLGWLGVRSLQQERAVEVQRVRDELESSADLIAAEIRQNLAEVEEQLTRLAVLPAARLDDAASEYADNLGEDALVVVFGVEAVNAYPGDRLLYYPAVRTPVEPAARVFAAGELYEFRSLDFERAIAYFTRLSEDDDEQVRTGALLRLARNQRKIGRLDAAMATYDALAGMGAVSVGGQPAALVARRARCELLEQLGRQAELKAEAEKLDRELHSGRWRLTQATFLYFAGAAREWLAIDADSQGDSRETPAGPRPVGLSLAASVDSLWERWQQDPQAEEMLAGRSSLMAHERSVLLLWRGTTDRLVALAAAPAFLERHLIGRSQGLLERQGVGVVLADVEGQTIVSYQIADSQAQNVLRTVADTRLPWTLRVLNADAETDLAQLTARRRLLFAGLGVVALLVVAGSYFSARAMALESEAARLQSDFVAAVSHEFRTPLTSMRQFTELLADGRVSNEEERNRCYGALHRGTRRLARLVEDLLDFGRMEAGSHAFTLVPVGAKQWVEEVTSEFQEEVGGRGYRLELVWNGAEATVVRADEAALGRALWNLLDNAVKYSPTCKTIWLEGRCEEGWLAVSVRDRGIGVPPQEQRKIFGKFVRGSIPTGQTVKGTGLGLALVEQIVQAHGGRMRLESAVGEGSTFTILLPVDA